MGGRYEVYLGTASEPKKAGLEDVRSSLNLETIVYLAVYKLVLTYLELTTRQQCRSRLLQHHV